MFIILDDNIMLGAFEEVQHFQLLLKAIKAKKCLEVGTYTGYTALSLALALDEDGQVITTDINSDKVAFDIWKRAGMEKKVRISIFLQISQTRTFRLRPMQK